MRSVISILLLIIGLGLCFFGVFATIKRYSTPTSVSAPGITLGLPESLGLIILGLASIGGAAWVSGIVPPELDHTGTAKPPDTSQPVLTTTSTSQPVLTTTSTARRKSAVCTRTLATLKNERTAVDLAIDQVTTDGEGNPTDTMAGYSDARKKVTSAANSAMSALTEYIGAGLKIPSGKEIPKAEELQTIINDINDFLRRLPSEIDHGTWQEDWGALDDRPNYITNAINAMAPQCSSLAP